MTVRYEDWHFKPIKAFTLKDALDCMAEGFICICSDGKVNTLTNSEELF